MLPPPPISSGRAKYKSRGCPSYPCLACFPELAESRHHALTAIIGEWREEREKRRDTVEPGSTQKGARMLQGAECPRFQKSTVRWRTTDGQEGAPELGEVEIFIVSGGMGQGGKDLGAGPKAAQFQSRPLKVK